MPSPGRRSLCRKPGAAGSPPTITSVTPNSVSNTTALVTPYSVVIAGTNLTGATEIAMLDTTHGNVPTNFVASGVTSAVRIDATYDGTEGMAVQVTVVRVTTPYGSATKAFTVTI